MKKLIQIMLPLSLMFGTVSLIAQDFGIRAAVNLAKVTGDADDNTFKSGIQFGPVVDFTINENFKLHSGLLYSMKGAKDDATNENLKSDYLDIPILVRYRFVGGLYAELGPNIGILLSAKSGDLDIKDWYRTLDVGAIMGLGYSLGPFRVDGRYGIGLTNVLDSTIFTGTSIKNAVITIGGTFMF